MSVKNIVCVIGTRPEAIKMAPLVLQLKRATWANITVVATAQHRQMLDQILQLFKIVPDIDLNVMKPNQGLPELTAHLLTDLDKVLAEKAADVVIAQGDTTTAFAAALASFYRRIPFCHVEAGLRTNDIYSPFPEEMNRVLSDHLSYLNFAPTETAKQNLLANGVINDSIYVTGNTVIDSLLEVARQNVPHGLALDPSKRLILVTEHRRENFGAPFLNICKTLRTLADTVEDIQIVYPVHPNPNVKEVAYQQLGNHPRILLCNPMDYGPFVSLMKQAYLILTDSGGVQEEAPALGKPVLVLRKKTERPEAVEQGVVKLVGTESHEILAAALELLNNPQAYAQMARGSSPYGDGYAAQRITSILYEKIAA